MEYPLCFYIRIHILKDHVRLFCIALENCLSGHISIATYQLPKSLLKRERIK